MKTLKILVSIPLLGILIAILIPAFYAMAWMLALMLPIACSIFVVFDAWRGDDPAKRKEVLTNLALAALVVPAAILAFAAPLRAIVLAVMSYFPGAMAVFNEIHAPLYAPFVAISGHLGPYWLDVWWGVAGAAVIFLVAMAASIRRNRLARQVAILPTAKIRSAPIGLVELKGRAMALAGKVKSQPIMRAWTESTNDGHSSRTHIDPFYLDDGTGLVLVDPRGASINHEGSFFGIGLHQAILKLVDKPGFPESRLMHGDTVYLVGNLQINRDREAYPDEEVLVRPRKSSWLSMNFYDLFLVSNISEAALLEGFRSSVGRGWGLVVLGMSMCLWLSAFGLTNVMQIEASRTDAAPQYLRLVSTPTTLERRIEVDGLGRHPTIHFVDRLREGDREKTDAIMRRFRDLGLVYLATPILVGQAVDIDAPGFGIANYWLGRTHGLPHGHWGAQLFDDRYAGARWEVLVLRVMTRYRDRRLSVSYRAWADPERKPKRDRIVRREVVVTLTNETTGKEHTAAFPVEAGHIRGDDVEAFEYLDPGPYEIQAFLATRYRSGLYDRGSRKRSAAVILLED